MLASPETVIKNITTRKPKRRSLPRKMITSPASLLSLSLIFGTAAIYAKELKTFVDKNFPPICTTSTSADYTNPDYYRPVCENNFLRMPWDNVPWYDDVAFLTDTGFIVAGTFLALSLLSSIEKTWHLSAVKNLPRHKIIPQLLEKSYALLSENRHFMDKPILKIDGQYDRSNNAFWERFRERHNRISQQFNDLPNIEGVSLVNTAGVTACIISIAMMGAILAEPHTNLQFLSTVTEYLPDLQSLMVGTFTGMAIVTFLIGTQYEQTSRMNHMISEHLNDIQTLEA